MMANIIRFQSECKGHIAGDLSTKGLYGTLEEYAAELGYVPDVAGLQVRDLNRRRSHQPKPFRDLFWMQKISVPLKYSWCWDEDPSKIIYFG